MALYFQKKDSGLQIVYLASTTKFDKEKVDLQIKTALRLYGISPLGAQELEKDVIRGTRKKLRGEPELNSITEYLDYTRYSSVNLPADHTQCIIELPRNLENLVVAIHSWTPMNEEQLKRYIQRTVIDDLHRNGIQERDSKKSDIPSRYLDQSQAFSTSYDAKMYAPRHS